MLYLQSIQSQNTNYANRPPPRLPYTTRLLRKQQMAEPPRRIERTAPVYIAAGCSGPVGDPLAAAVNEAVLRDAIQRACRSLIAPLDRSASVAPITRRLVAEVEAHIGDEMPLDPTALHLVVLERGRSRPTPIPGTRTRRGDVAGLALRIMGADPRLTGRDAREAFQEEAGQYAEAPVEDIDVLEPSAARPFVPAFRSHAGSGERRRSDRTTDRVRIVSDHLRWVLQGTETAREAAAAFDWTPGSRGRPPRAEVRTFADYLRSKIAFAEDVGNQDLAQITPKGVSPTHRRAATMALRRRLAETGAERAGELRRHLATLTNTAR